MTIMSIGLWSRKASSESYAAAPCDAASSRAFAPLAPCTAATTTPGMAAAARAWVWLMFPAPMSPTWIVTAGAGSRRGRGELPIALFGLRGCRRPRQDEDPVAEGRRSARGQRVLQLLLAVAEHLLPEGSRGEEAIAARVPVGREARVLRMIQHQDGDRLAVDRSREAHPAAPRSPDVVALLAFAAEIHPGHALVVEHGHRGGAALGVRVDLGRLARVLEAAGDPQAEHALLGVVEDDGLVRGGERREAVDAPPVGAGAE